MQPSDSPYPRPEIIVRVMQIIAFALLMGATVFLVVALFVPFDGLKPRAPLPDEHAHVGPDMPEIAGLPLLIFVGLIFAGSTLMAHFLVPPIIATNRLKQLARSPQPEDPEELTMSLLALRQTVMIIAFALMEGTSFFGSLAYMITRHPIALVISVFPLLVIAAQFPTFGGVMNWVEEQKRRLSDLRATGGLG